MAYKYVRVSHKVGKHTTIVRKYNSKSPVYGAVVGFAIGKYIGDLITRIIAGIWRLIVSIILSIVNLFIWIINQFIYIVQGTTKERIKAIISLVIITACIIAACIIAKDIKKIRSDNLEKNATQNAVVEANTEAIATADPIEVVADNDIESEFIFADSDQRFLTDDEVKDLSKEEIRFAINEIYARRGRAYSDPELKAYFESKSWYTPLYSKSEFSDDVFNEYEKANINFLVKYR